MTVNNALYYAQIGWRLFPCKWDYPIKKGIKGKKKTHVPFIKWSSESSDDPNTIKKWARKFPHCYFCVALQQSGLSVVDIDNKKGKNGSQSLIELSLDYGMLPNTLISKTPSGGYHHFFQGTCANTVDKLGTGLDTPVMVPIPESAVEGKGLYSCAVKREVADLPPWVVEKVGEKREKAENNDCVIDEDLPHNISLAVKYLIEEAEPSIKGEGGDNTAYKTVCAVRDFGISRLTALNLMFEFWNERGDPWDFDKLKVKVDNAYEYALKPSGQDTPEADFKPVEPPPIDKPLHIKDFSNTEPPEREWIIKNWLPVSEIASLYGRGGLGKSTIAFQLAAAVASGQPFMGFEIENKMPVIYVACEDTKDELHRRWHSILNTPQYDFGDYREINLHPWPRVGLDSTLAVSLNNRVKKGAFHPILTRALTDMDPGPKMLILDTISDIFAGNESDRFSVNHFIKVTLAHLREKFDLTILLIGHPAKSLESKYSGSTAWENAIRTLFSLGPHENENLDDCRVFKLKKANYTKAGPQFTLQWKNGIYEKINESEIIDTVLEENADIMMDLIAKQSRINKPFGYHHNSPNCIFHTRIKGVDGKEMDRDLKKEIISMLDMEGVIEIIKNQSSGNGIWAT